MEPRCTCGAVLPDAARFCHKCGKPQFEEDIARMQAPEPAAPRPAQPSAGVLAPYTDRISFKDTRAVGVTVLAALVTFMALMVAAMLVPAASSVILPMLLLLSGFVVPRIYQRRAGGAISTAAGARLGWMTGVWFFLGAMLLVSLVCLALNTPEGAQAMHQLQNSPQFAQMKVSSSHDLAMALLMSAVPTFLLFTLLPGLGGMLGARFWRKASSEAE